MANFGLAELRLVNPRDGWPSEKARSAASRADHVIDAAKLYGSLEEAIADLNFVYATTARDRDGYVWIATGDGLARYDGLEMRVWRHDPADPDSLPGNNVQFVHVDARDRVWVAVENGGRLVSFKAGSEVHKVDVSNGRTVVTISGKKEKRASLKPGMTCRIVYPDPGAEAKVIDCN